MYFRFCSPLASAIVLSLLSNQASAQKSPLLQRRQDGSTCFNDMYTEVVDQFPQLCSYVIDLASTTTVDATPTIFEYVITGTVTNTRVQEVRTTTTIVSTITQAPKVLRKREAEPVLEDPPPEFFSRIRAMLQKVSSAQDPSYLDPSDTELVESFSSACSCANVATATAYLTNTAPPVVSTRYGQTRKGETLNRTLVFTEYSRTTVTANTVSLDSSSTSVGEASSSSASSSTQLSSSLTETPSQITVSATTLTGSLIPPGPTASSFACPIADNQTISNIVHNQRNDYRVLCNSDIVNTNPIFRYDSARDESECAARCSQANSGFLSTTSRSPICQAAAFSEGVCSLYAEAINIATVQGSTLALLEGISNTPDIPRSLWNRTSVPTPNRIGNPQELSSSLSSLFINEGPVTAPPVLIFSTGTGYAGSTCTTTTSGAWYSWYCAFSSYSEWVATYGYSWTRVYTTIVTIRNEERRYITTVVNGTSTVLTLQGSGVSLIAQPTTVTEVLTTASVSISGTTFAGSTSGTSAVPSQTGSLTLPTETGTPVFNTSTAALGTGTGAASTGATSTSSSEANPTLTSLSTTVVTGQSSAVGNGSYTSVTGQFGSSSSAVNTTTTTTILVTISPIASGTYITLATSSGGTETGGSGTLPPGNATTYSTELTSTTTSTETISGSLPSGGFSVYPNETIIESTSTTTVSTTVSLGTGITFVPPTNSSAENTASVTGPVTVTLPLTSDISTTVTISGNETGSFPNSTLVLETPSTSPISSTASIPPGTGVASSLVSSINGTISTESGIFESTTTITTAITISGTGLLYTGGSSATSASGSASGIYLNSSISETTTTSTESVTITLPLSTTSDLTLSLSTGASSYVSESSSGTGFFPNSSIEVITTTTTQTLVPISTGISETSQSGTVILSTGVSGVPGTIVSGTGLFPNSTAGSTTAQETASLSTGVIGTGVSPNSSIESTTTITTTELSTLSSVSGLPVESTTGGAGYFPNSSVETTTTTTIAITLPLSTGVSGSPVISSTGGGGVFPNETTTTTTLAVTLILSTGISGSPIIPSTSGGGVFPNETTTTTTLAVTIPLSTGVSGLPIISSTGGTGVFPNSTLESIPLTTAPLNTGASELPTLTDTGYFPNSTVPGSTTPVTGTAPLGTGVSSLPGTTGIYQNSTSTVTLVSLTYEAPLTTGVSGFPITTGTGNVIFPNGTFILTSSVAVITLSVNNSTSLSTITISEVSRTGEQTAPVYTTASGIFQNSSSAIGTGGPTAFPTTLSTVFTTSANTSIIFPNSTEALGTGTVPVTQTSPFGNSTVGSLGPTAAPPGYTSAPFSNVTETEIYSTSLGTAPFATLPSATFPTPSNFTITGGPVGPTEPSSVIVSLNSSILTTSAPFINGTILPTATGTGFISVPPWNSSIPILTVGPTAIPGLTNTTTLSLGTGSSLIIVPTSGFPTPTDQNQTATASASETTGLFVNSTAPVGTGFGTGTVILSTGASTSTPSGISSCEGATVTTTEFMTTQYITVTVNSPLACSSCPSSSSLLSPSAPTYVPPASSASSSAPNATPTPVSLNRRAFGQVASPRQIDDACRPDVDPIINGNFVQADNDGNAADWTPETDSMAMYFMSFNSADGAGKEGRFISSESGASIRVAQPLTLCPGRNYTFEATTRQPSRGNGCTTDYNLGNQTMFTVGSWSSVDRESGRATFTAGPQAQDVSADLQIAVRCDGKPDGSGYFIVSVANLTLTPN